jgi:hypothetical protein
LSAFHLCKSVEFDSAHLTITHHDGRRERPFFLAASHITATKSSAASKTVKTNAAEAALAASHPPRAIPDFG